MIINVPVAKVAHAVINVTTVLAYATNLINSTEILNANATELLNGTAIGTTNETMTTTNGTLTDAPSHFISEVVYILTVFALGWVGSATLYAFVEATVGTDTIGNLFRRQISNSVTGTMSFAPHGSPGTASKGSIDIAMQTMSLHGSCKDRLTGPHKSIQENSEHLESETRVLVETNSGDERPDNDPGKTDDYPQAPKVPPNSPLTIRSNVSETKIRDVRKLQEKLVELAASAITNTCTSI